MRPGSEHTVERTALPSASEGVTHPHLEEDDHLGGDHTVLAAGVDRELSDAIDVALDVVLDAAVVAGEDEARQQEVADVEDCRAEGRRPRRRQPTRSLSFSLGNSLGLGWRRRLPISCLERPGRSSSGQALDTLGCSGVYRQGFGLLEGC